MAVLERIMYSLQTFFSFSRNSFLMFISWSVDLQPHLNDCSDKSKSLETKMLVGAVEVN